MGAPPLCQTFAIKGYFANYFCEAQARVRQGWANVGPLGERPSSLNPCLELTLKLVADDGMILIGAGAGAGGAWRGERCTDRAAERHGPRQVRARHRAAAPGQVRHPRHPLLRGEQSFIQGRFCLGALRAIAQILFNILEFKPRKGQIPKSVTGQKRH